MLLKIIPTIRSEAKVKIDNYNNYLIKPSLNWKLQSLQSEFILAILIKESQTKS